MHHRLAAACAVLATACGADATDPISGRVTAFDGSPIASVTVHADSNDGGWLAVTATDGRFTLAVPPERSFHVWTQSHGWPSLFADVGSGRVDLELQMPEVLSVTGMLVDDAGVPIANRRLVLHNPAGETTGPRGQRGSSTGGSATTAADGSFRIEGLLPGPHVIDVPGQVPPGSPQLRCTTALVAAGSEGVRLVATTDATVSGVVLDPSGKRAAYAQVHVGRRTFQYGPSPGAEISLWMPGATCDAEGRFQLTGLPPGPVEIQVNGAEWTSAKLTFDAPATDVEIRLAPPHLPLTKGSILAVDGAPLATASLRLTHETRDDLQYFTGTDASGGFVAPHLREGRYVVEMLKTHGDWQGPATRVGTVEAGATGVVLQLAE